MGFLLCPTLPPVLPVQMLALLVGQERMNIDEPGVLACSPAVTSRLSVNASLLMGCCQRLVQQC